MSDREILHAYRALHRAGLRAIKFHFHHRHTLQQRLRHAFRTNPRSAFDSTKVANTLTFLRLASRRDPASLECRVLVNYLIACYWRHRLQPSNRQPTSELRHIATHQAYEAFDREVRQLNEDLGICLQ